MWQKNPTGMKPRDLKFGSEILSQKITLSSDFREKKFENEKYYYDCKFLTVREKNSNKKVELDFSHSKHFQKI